MPVYTALSDHQFLNENNMMVVPYCPLLAPCDFILFPKLKIRGYNGDSSSVTGGARVHHKMGIPQEPSEVGVVLGPVYNL